MTKDLIHPITCRRTKATLKQDETKIYIEIKFADGYIIRDQNYIYDILLESGVIKPQDYPTLN